MSKKKSNEKVQINKQAYIDHIKSPVFIFGIITAILAFAFLNIIYPSIKRNYLEGISVIGGIQKKSTVIIDGPCLNLELEFKLINKSSFNIDIDTVECYYKRRNIFTRIFWFINDKAGKLEVLNITPENEEIKTSLHPEDFERYRVFVNVPIPDKINEIRQVWESNNYQLTYQQLMEEIPLSQQDIILVVKTKPEFEDDAIIRLFQKEPSFK